MKNTGRVILLLCVSASAAVLMFSLVRGYRSGRALRFICTNVYQKHYYGPEALREWYQECLMAVDDVTADNVIAVARALLAKLETSHLDIYTPQEDQAVWTGQQASDSGMRARAIDGRYVIWRVYAEGAAAKAGVQVGDEIHSAGDRLLDPDVIMTLEGEITIRRSGSLIKVVIAPKPLQVDQAPQLSRVTGSVGKLEISSFRQEYFKREDWVRLAAEFKNYSALVVDVRGNLGGDFVALLRALSVFLCEGGVYVGDLVRPQAKSGEAKVEDDATVSELYDLLVGNARLRLETFNGYPCYGGPVTVLADADSASVSEIFALAMSGRQRTRVWGERTRGDMLLGVWYNLDLLGKGYTLSVPEALYLSPSGDAIEGRGVQPSRDLYYRLEDARRGEDSWVKAASTTY